MAWAIEEQIDVVTHVHKKVNYERTKPNSFQMSDNTSTLQSVPWSSELSISHSYNLLLICIWRTFNLYFSGWLMEQNLNKSYNLLSLI